MANRSCSPAAPPVPCASGDSGSTGHGHPSVLRSQVNSPSTRQRLRRGTDWCSHNSSGTGTSIASTQGSQLNWSQRRRRLKPTPTFHQMVGDWRSARVAPGTSQSGWQQRTGRTHASSPTTRGNGQAHPRGRQMDDQSPSIVRTVVIRFTFGPSTRKAARHARSRLDRVLRRSPGGRATAGGFISRAIRTVRGISGV